jgi:hypothetical protein
VCLNDSGNRHNSISCLSLSIVNKGAAINKPSVVSLRKSAFLNVVWAGAPQGSQGRSERGVLKREEEERLD